MSKPGHDDALVAADKIEHLRHDLTAKLDELKRRVERAKHALSPSSYLQRPWVIAGAAAAAALAYVLLRPRRDQPEGLVRWTARAGLVAAVKAVVWNAISHEVGDRSIPTRRA